MRQSTAWYSKVTFRKSVSEKGGWVNTVCAPSRTTDTQTELFFKNSKLLGLGRQIGPKFYEAFGVFLAKL